MLASTWEEITPDALIDAVSHIRRRFDLTDFSHGFSTQQNCYKALHPVSAGTAPSAIFKHFLDAYGTGLWELISTQFGHLLEIGLANSELLSQHPVDWAQVQLKFLIDDKPERAKLWIKNSCDLQPISRTTTPEDMEEFVNWDAWRAPRFIVMQPSGNAPYDSATAWERVEREETEKYLEGLSKRFLNSLLFHLEETSGDAHMKLAKKGVRIQRTKAERDVSQSDAETDSSTTEASVVAFVSYSWDSDSHKEWVRSLASRLQAEGGVQVILDQWHLLPGGDKAVFMEKSVTQSKFVVLICTPEYAKKANDRTGGAGYEATIITGELGEKINERKFIPVLRTGEWTISLPVWIKTKLGVDLRNNPYSDNEYENLLRALHSEPLKPPPIGPKPIFRNNSPLTEEIDPPDRALQALREVEDLKMEDRQAVQRNLSVVRLNALHPSLTIWLTNRSDFDVKVKSISLWYGKAGRDHKRLNHAVPSDNRKFVDLRPHAENAPSAFITDDDAMLRLQNFGIVERNFPLHTYLDGVDLQLRVEYDLLGVDDEYQETVAVRIYGNRQIDSR